MVIGENPMDQPLKPAHYVLPFIKDKTNKLLDKEISIINKNEHNNFLIKIEKERLDSINKTKNKEYELWKLKYDTKHTHAYVPYHESGIIKEDQNGDE